MIKNEKVSILKLTVRETNENVNVYHKCGRDRQEQHLGPKSSLPSPYDMGILSSNT
jgi:hypothetical protein